MSKYVTEWHQRKVVDAITVQVADGMEKACAMVEEAAKARVPVRTGLSKSEITHQVQTDGADIVGYVGVFQSSKAWYARFVEFGTRNMRAQPFIRPAVFENARRIVKLITGG